MPLETFDDVLKSIQKNKDRKFHLLLGNGFSMAYNSDIFSYNALHQFIEQLDDELLSKVFEVVKTKNFELIMQQLDTFALLVDALGSNDDLKTKVQDASSSLKKSLIDAVKALHPEHVFTLPENKLNACDYFISSFLNAKGSIFTTNYDLLLYWVLMRGSNTRLGDGFGRERLNPDEFVPDDEIEYSELRWGKHKNEQVIHYIHGALPLFDAGIDIIKEEYTGYHFLLENIENRMNKGEYPVFITAGNGTEKLTHIRHNRYLSFCYDKFSEIDGSLVTFGFNFGEYDDHIIDAINIAANYGRKSTKCLRSIYIGAYSDTDVKHIERIKNRFKCKVHIFDAKSANVWG